MKPRTTMRRALADPNLLGQVFAEENRKQWRVLLIAMMGEELKDDERIIFKELTQREREPLERVEKFAGVIGRRGGKSQAISSGLIPYVSALCDHSDALAPGETGVVLCVAPDLRQASITLDYSTATFANSPILRQLIASRTADALTLTNGISIGGPRRVIQKAA